MHKSQDPCKPTAPNRNKGTEARLVALGAPRLGNRPEGPANWQEARQSALFAQPTDIIMFRYAGGAQLCVSRCVHMCARVPGGAGLHAAAELRQLNHGGAGTPLGHLHVPLGPRDAVVVAPEDLPGADARLVMGGWVSSPQYVLSNKRNC